MNTSVVRRRFDALRTSLQRVLRAARGGPLARCDHLGERALVFGKPFVVNNGHLDIGDDFKLSCEPVVTHLVTEGMGRITIGNQVTIGHGSGLAARDSIVIGSGTRLGAYVLVMDTDFHVPGDSEAEAPTGPIRIGKNVQIGNHATILRGTVIGDDAIICDGSVVSGHVPDGSQFAGVPARAVNSNHPENIVRNTTNTTEERVSIVAMKTFRLSNLPELHSQQSEIQAWDSLGSLNFILALEDEFNVLLAEDEMARARSLQEVARIVKAASERSPNTLAEPTH